MFIVVNIAMLGQPVTFVPYIRTNFIKNRLVIDGQHSISIQMLLPFLRCNLGPNALKQSRIFNLLTYRRGVIKRQEFRNGLKYLQEFLFRDLNNFPKYFLVVYPKLKFKMFDESSNADNFLFIFIAISVNHLIEHVLDIYCFVVVIVLDVDQQFALFIFGYSFTLFFLYYAELAMQL